MKVLIVVLSLFLVGCFETEKEANDTSTIRMSKELFDRMCDGRSRVRTYYEDKFNVEAVFNIKHCGPAFRQRIKIRYIKELGDILKENNCNLEPKAWDQIYEIPVNGE